MSGYQLQSAEWGSRMSHVAKLGRPRINLIHILQRPSTTNRKHRQLIHPRKVTAIQLDMSHFQQRDTAWLIWHECQRMDDENLDSTRLEQEQSLA